MGTHELERVLRGTSEDMKRKRVCVRHSQAGGYTGRNE